MSVIKKKNDFLYNKDNQEYVTWKSMMLLQKYISRFNNIKPRKYNKHSVGMQKKLRKAIIRAREIGILSYIN